MGVRALDDGNRDLSGGRPPGRGDDGEVADAADVSQGYVYEVAETLVDRGLVTVDESASPTVLRARPASEAVAELSTRLSDLQSAIEDAYAEPDATDVGFEVVRSRRTVERCANRYLADATHEAFVVVPATAFADLTESMTAAVDRGVFVYCMLLAPDADIVIDAVADFRQYAHVVRTWEARPQIFVLRDARAGLVGSHGVLTGRHDDEYAVAFGRPEVANGSYGNVVSNVWPIGQLRYCGAPPAPYSPWLCPLLPLRSSSSLVPWRSSVARSATRSSPSVARKQTTPTYSSELGSVTRRLTTLFPYPSAVPRNPSVEVVQPSPATPASCSAASVSSGHDGFRSMRVHSTVRA